MEHGGHMSRCKRNAALQVCMHFLNSFCSLVCYLSIICCNLGVKMFPLSVVNPSSLGRMGVSTVSSYLCPDTNKLPVPEK